MDTVRVIHKESQIPNTEHIPMTSKVENTLTDMFIKRAVDLSPPEQWRMVPSMISSQKPSSDAHQMQDPVLDPVSIEVPLRESNEPVDNHSRLQKTISTSVLPRIGNTSLTKPMKSKVISTRRLIQAAKTDIMGTRVKLSALKVDISEVSVFRMICIIILDPEPRRRTAIHMGI